MDAQHKNLEVIARGNGSPQARAEDELCWGEAGELDIEGYKEYIRSKYEKNHLHSR